MKIKIPYKIVVVSSIILGVFISIQLRTLDLENGGLTTSKKGEELAVKLKGLKKEEEELNLEIKNLRDSIQKYKLNEGDSTIISEIDKYETLSGYTDVKGNGIKVTIKSNESAGNDLNGIMYNYDLLLSMINKLNSAQANAVSINDVRIVWNSYFHIKEDKLYINDTQISEPYTIKAIGNSDTLASALQIKYGIAWEIEEYYNAKVEIEKSDEIKIKSHESKEDIKNSKNGGNNKNE